MMRYDEMNVVKKIVLGISGSIAASKIPDLVSCLLSEGHEVKIVATKASENFIDREVLQRLSKNKIYTELFSPDPDGMMEHITLARWADLVLIAPATANILAKLRYGMADDLLTTLCLATTAPIFVVPAMNQAMWKNIFVQSNVQTLRESGMHFIGPVVGNLACGEEGPGRMAEVSDIVDTIFTTAPVIEAYLEGQKILITAGPTREYIDPVRYISNRSSGKMGYALAEAAKLAGAEVTLISGPTHLQVSEGITVINTITAEEMYTAVMNNIINQTMFIATAAVSDYRTKTEYPQKIKRTTADLTLDLEANKDILSIVSHQKPHVLTVGFAAETENIEDNAQKKLLNKKLDLVIANDVSRSDIGFDSDDNAVTLFFASGEKITLDKESKFNLAKKMLKIIKTNIIDRVNDYPSKTDLSLYKVL